MLYKFSSQKRLSFLLCSLLALNSSDISNTKTLFKFSHKKIKIGNLVLSSEILELLFFVLKSKNVKRIGKKIIKLCEDSLSLKNTQDYEKVRLLAKYIQQFKYYYYRYFSQYQLENFIVYNNKELNIIAIDILFVLVDY